MKKDRVSKRFLEELKKVPIVQVACEKCGISRQTVYRWRKEDHEFQRLMDEALEEGEFLVNDVAESKLLSLIKKEHFSAIRYWLEKRHPKFRKQDIQKQIDEDEESERVIKAMGLTDEDFLDENLEETKKRISDYLEENRWY